MPRAILMPVAGAGALNTEEAVAWGAGGAAQTAAASREAVGGGGGGGGAFDPTASAVRVYSYDSPFLLHIICSY